MPTNDQYQRRPTKERLSAAELTDVWALLSQPDRVEAFLTMSRGQSEELFFEQPADQQLKLLYDLPEDERRSWMRLLAPDHATDLIQSASTEDRTTLLSLLDASTSKEVNALLACAEDRAGGLMSPRYARVRPDMTVDEAVSYLRKQARAQVETIYVAYVLGEEQRLVGLVSFRDLFAADSRTTVNDIMRTDFVRVTDQQDQEKVGRLFAQHDLSAIPVVDSAGVMKDIVTVDDIVDVVQEEATAWRNEVYGRDFIGRLKEFASWLPS